MPRRLRKDYPGAWWHVMNRAVAGAILFPSEPHGRQFLTLLARSVHAGWIETHAYCLMPNHFHLQIRSPRGKLSKALHWIEYGYALRFNRQSDRAGSLFGGRFLAKLMHSQRYRRAGFVYIHRNPEKAGLDGGSDVYWDSSEQCHRLGTGHPWVSRSFGRSVLVARDAIPTELFERWLKDGRPDLRETDLLLKGSIHVLLTWLRNTAPPEGSLPPGRSLILPSTLRRTLRQFRREDRWVGPWIDQPRQDRWKLLESGLLRMACGLTCTAIAEATDATRLTVRRRLDVHVRALHADDLYLHHAAAVLGECLRLDYQPRPA